MQAYWPILLHVRKAKCVQPTKIALFTALPHHSKVDLEQTGNISRFHMLQMKTGARLPPCPHAKWAQRTVC